MVPVHPRAYEPIPSLQAVQPPRSQRFCLNPQITYLFWAPACYAFLKAVLKTVLL